MLDDLISKTGACIADVFKDETYAKWARTPAGYVEKPDSDLIYRASGIMKGFLDSYKWFAVSSNNIYWNETEKPISVIATPVNGVLSTIINPEISYPNQETESSTEGCGSLGECLFEVERYSCIRIKGFFLEEKKERTIYLKDEEAVIAQHEIEHLRGQLVCDKGPFLYLNERYDKVLEIINLLNMFEYANNPMFSINSIYLKNNNLILSPTEEVPENSSYGKTISLRFPDTRGMKYFLDNMPYSTNSPYSFLKKGITEM